MKQQEPPCIIAALVEAQIETEVMIARMSELVARIQRKFAPSEQDDPRQGPPPGAPMR